MDMTIFVKNYDNSSQPYKNLIFQISKILTFYPRIVGIIKIVQHFGVHLTYQ